MSLDLEAIRRKLKQLQEGNKGQAKVSDYVWKPPVGQSTIRIVPYAYNQSNPFQELYFHYEVGKRTMISPRSFNRPDPIVEFSDRLKQTGDKEDWKLGKKLEPKFRVMVPVIVRGEEDKGVRFWAFGTKIYTELLGYISDEDYGDITDLTNGRDLTIEHIPAAAEGGFPEVKIRVKPNKTAATNDPEIARMIVQEQKQITEVYNELSYDDMKAALEKWLNPTPEPADNPAGKPVASSTKVKQTNSISDVKSAFDDLFKDTE